MASSRSSSLTFFFACGIALVLFGLFLYVWQQAERTKGAISQMQSELLPFVLPPIVFDDTEYQILKGVIHPEPKNKTDALQILLLARYIAEMRAAPLYALEGADVALMEENLRHLEQSTLPFKTFFNASDEERALSDIIHPYAFLRSLAELETLRRSLINTPNDKVLEEYHTTLLKTASLQREYVANILPLLQESEQSSPQVTFTAWGGAIDPHSIRRAIESIGHEAALREVEILKRYQCYKGHRQECSTILPLQSNTLRETGEELDESMHTRVTQNLTILNTVYQTTIEGVQPRTPQDPIVAITTSACYPDHSPVFYYRFHIETQEGAKRDRIALLNDLYFYQYETIEPTDNLYIELRKKHGITLEFQEIANLYMCPASGDVETTVHALYAIRDFLRENPFVTNKVPERADQRLSHLEAQIMNGDIVFERDVHEYLSLLSEELRENEEVFEAAFGAGSTDNAYHLIELWNQKGSGLPYTIGTIAYYNDELLSTLRLKRPSLWYMLALRTYFSSLLLPYNNSVNRSDISFFIEPQPTTLENAKVETYREGSLQHLSPESVAAYIIKTSETLRQANEAILAE